MALVHVKSGNFVEEGVERLVTMGKHESARVGQGVVPVRENLSGQCKQQTELFANSGIPEQQHRFYRYLGVPQPW